jgi:6,7-dimethyl-8-ribityllumazine synthase
MSSSSNRGARPELSGQEIRLAVVCGRFNDLITDKLLEGVYRATDKYGPPRGVITEVWVPGAFEIPLAAKKLAPTHEAVVCLGAVIRGDTPHFDFVAGQCASGIMQVQLETGTPVIFGVLTTDTVEQAEERARDDDTNKGFEAAETAIEMAMLLKELPRC